MNGTKTGLRSPLPEVRAKGGGSATDTPVTCDEASSQRDATRSRGSLQGLIEGMNEQFTQVYPGTVQRTNHQARPSTLRVRALKEI